MKVMIVAVCGLFADCWAGLPLAAGPQTGCLYCHPNIGRFGPTIEKTPAQYTFTMINCEEWTKNTVEISVLFFFWQVSLDWCVVIWVD